VPELALDGVLSPAGVTHDFAELVARLGPFGAGNAEPRFALSSARVHRAEVVGGAHVRCLLGDAAGAGRLRAIAFRCLESPLGKALLETGGASVHVAGTLRCEEWQGERRLQFCIDDAALAYRQA
jgi:single-stranded-DNA-specific exonuclease